MLAPFNLINGRYAKIERNIGSPSLCLPVSVSPDEMVKALINLQFLLYVRW